jgi:hypothetical protein
MNETPQSPTETAAPITVSLGDALAGVASVTAATTAGVTAHNGLKTAITKATERSVTHAGAIWELMKEAATQGRDFSTIQESVSLLAGAKNVDFIKDKFSHLDRTTLGNVSMETLFHGQIVTKLLESPAFMRQAALTVGAMLAAGAGAYVGSKILIGMTQQREPEDTRPSVNVQKPTHVGYATENETVLKPSK